MTHLAAPVAARLRAPSWRDTRLVVGLLIVLLSAVVGARVVAAADHSAPVYAARHTLTAGTPLNDDVLQVVRVHLASEVAPYLPAGENLAPGRVALRTVAAGELLPASAVGASADLVTKPVSVPLPSAPPSGLVTGALVDIWVSQRSDGGGTVSYLPPRRVVSAASVSDVTSGGGALGSSRSSSVQVLLADDATREVLDALANEAKIALVAVPGSSPAANGG